MSVVAGLTDQLIFMFSTKRLFMIKTSRNTERTS